MRISDWSSDVCSSDLIAISIDGPPLLPVRMWLSWGEATNRIAEAVGLAAAAGETGLNWQGLLPPGDYYLSITHIGRASCRERVCQYVMISVGVVSLKKKNT